MKLTEIVSGIYRRIEEQGERPVWISLVPEVKAVGRASQLESDPHARNLPLFGIPFAVKDNIDVAGMPTTAACPAYAYTPRANAPVVDRLLAAGAILIGKTNMDQFATGLVGTRSPYGICSSVFDPRYISGGSSAGSAVAVASGLVEFSLGTDTAGSGRVPAAFNGIVGLKPTRNVISTQGVVPACRSLDCVSIFARTNAVAEAVLKAAADPAPVTAPWASGSFRFGVPTQLEFFGDIAAEILFNKAIERLIAIGGERVPFNYSPFRETANLLYSGPWVAERLAAIQGFFDEHAEDMDPTVRTIIGGAAKYSAVDTFNAQYKLEDLRVRTAPVWHDIDVMLLPTTGTTYTIEEVKANPIQLNTNLGYYTNFVNLLDLAAIALPAGARGNKLPFGVSLIAPAHTDTALLALGTRFTNEGKSPFVECAVVGAHLTGQPLNWQLTERKARLVRTCRTAPGYRFYALAGTVPAKPGLIREPAFKGPGIEVEVWSIPEEDFGSFVAAVPPPLAIGSAELEDGSSVKCFVCEPYGIQNAEEITHLGGWRNYANRLC
jgi:allophanate hydrolase